MKYILLAILITTTLTTQAQTLGQRAKATTVQKVGDRMDQSISGGVDSTVNKAGRAIGGLFKKKSKKTDPSQPTTDPNASTPNNQPNIAPQSNTPQSTTTPTAPAVVTAYGDFTPGVTTLFDDDFAQDALQDFPAKWNTNGSGKLVSIDGLPGKWLDIAHNSVVNPVLNKPLPDDCTISFDLFLQTQGDQSTPSIQFGLTPVSDILKEDLFYKEKFYVGITRYHESDGHSLEYGLKDPVGNKNDFPLPSYSNKILHIDMAINKTRIRVYADRNKLIDLPRALTPSMHNNFYVASIMTVPAPQLDVLIGNIHIASAGTDARSLLVKQLMEEGKAVTNDILFDVNSDVIKPASFSVIDQLGAAMQQNPGLKILIVGHTDSDGSASLNLDLSKKRAAAVKNYLASHFSIDAARMQSDGKGASIPVASNTTEAGKSKNRRVEFTKI